MAAEFRVLSLVVPTRDFDFVRYCKQLNEETWVIVDVSIDSLLPRGQMARCQRRPSGCVIEAMPNGYSKVETHLDKDLNFVMFKYLILLG
jgi:homeobox-leucine zipper protein